MKGITFNEILKGANEEPLRLVLEKVPQWSNIQGITVPNSLCAQQCSSASSAQYKANVAFQQSAFCRLLNEGNPQQSAFCRLLNNSKTKNKELKIADLTGGLGVDSYYFSKVFHKVLYCEKDETLFNAAVNNFRLLGCNNIETRNCTVSKSFGDILQAFAPDAVYLDPARRDANGKKVFLLEDCEPDLTELLPMLQRVTPIILVKVSPMADITMLCKRIGPGLKEVHIVQVDNELKELLLVIDSETLTVGVLPTVTQEVTLTVGVLPTVGEGVALTVSILPTVNAGKTTGEEEKTKTGKTPDALFIDSIEQIQAGTIMFEGGAALNKAGIYNWISSEYGAMQLGPDAHFFIIDREKCKALLPFGKIYEIIERVPFNNQGIKYIEKTYPKCEVKARGLRITSDQLRKKIGSQSGGDIHIFALSTRFGDFLIAARRP